MERYVLEALQKAVTAAVAATTFPEVAVKYVGRQFTIPSDDKWLELVYIPNNIIGEFWGTEKTHRGVLRLLLHWPMDDAGAYPPIDALQPILDGFVKGVKYEDLGQNVKVQVTETPNILNVIEDAPEILVAASVRYNFFSS